VVLSAAQEIAEIQEGYVPFPVWSLVDNSVSDFDLFILLQSHFILYAPPGYHWERQELNDLVAAGYVRLFIRKDDEFKAKVYLQLGKLPSVDKMLPPATRIQSLEQIGAEFIRCLHEGEITAACVAKGESLASSVVDCMTEDPSCIKHLTSLADRDYYTFIHSIRVSAYATAIAVQMGLTAKHLLLKVALGGIFHDIGKKEIPLTILNKAGPLTEAEWVVMRSHPKTGHASVADSLLAHVPREIVLHHHEKLNGSGYPDGLSKGSLLQEVQIATLADVFDALTSSRSYQNKRSRFEALTLIRHKFLQDDISPEAFKALIACLA
jgi:putative nucleotidyltransferase with HDIG domain